MRSSSAINNQPESPTSPHRRFSLPSERFRPCLDGLGKILGISTILLASGTGTLGWLFFIQKARFAKLSSAVVVNSLCSLAEASLSEAPFVAVEGKTRESLRNIGDMKNQTIQQDEVEYATLSPHSPSSFVYYHRDVEPFSSAFLPGRPEHPVVEKTADFLIDLNAGAPHYSSTVCSSITIPRGLPALAGEAGFLGKFFSPTGKQSSGPAYQNRFLDALGKLLGRKHIMEHEFPVNSSVSVFGFLHKTGENSFEILPNPNKQQDKISQLQKHVHREEIPLIVSNRPVKEILKEEEDFTKQVKFFFQLSAAALTIFAAAWAARYFYCRQNRRLELEHEIEFRRQRWAERRAIQAARLERLRIFQRSEELREERKLMETMTKFEEPVQMLRILYKDRDGEEFKDGQEGIPTERRRNEESLEGLMDEMGRSPSPNNSPREISTAQRAAHRLSPASLLSINDDEKNSALRNSSEGEESDEGGEVEGAGGSFDHLEDSEANSDEGAMANSASCAICMDNRANVVFMNCAHLCCCEDCASKVALCPVCRARIKKKVKIFTV